MTTNIKHLLHSIGFWLLISFLFGAGVGGYTIHAYQKARMDEAIQLNGFVFDKKIFEVREKI